MAADMDTPQAAVEHGARIFDSIEPDLETLHRRTLSLLKVIEAGHGFNLMGALEFGALKGAAMSAAGDIGNALEKVYGLHRRLTDIAIRHDIDIPTTRGGGDR